MCHRTGTEARDGFDLTAGCWGTCDRKADQVRDCRKPYRPESVTQQWFGCIRTVRLHALIMQSASTR